MIIAGFALLTALSAPITQDQTAAAPTKAGKAANPNKRICKSVTVTGSRMPQSTCHTRAEWDEIDQANQSSVTPFQIPTNAQH